MKKFKKVLLLLVVLFSLTGCTKYMQYDGEKKDVVAPETGQRMVENILCKTTKTEETFETIKNEKIKEYQTQLDKNSITQEEFDDKVLKLNEKFSYADTVSCSSFKVTSGGYEGIWTSVFVKPLAFCIVKIGEFTKNYGWAIIITTILIRLVMYPLTKKTAMQSENMKKAQSKLEKLELKYRNRNDQESLMRKNQEMMAIYKEYNINPLSGCLFALIQIPLFFAFYEALYRLPVVFEEKFLGVDLGLTVSTALANGKIYYIIVSILVVLVTYYSFKLNSATNTANEQMKQMKSMTTFSTIMIGIASFTVSLGIALYWIINSGFTIIQNLIVKRSKKNDHIV